VSILTYSFPPLFAVLLFISPQTLADNNQNNVAANTDKLTIQKENESASLNKPIEATNSFWEQFDVEDSFYENPYQISLFSPQHGEDEERLWSQTSSIFYYGLGAIAVLASLPDNVTNWENSNENIGQKWVDNVTEGPVWDRDDIVLNYMLHPYFGGSYYQAARKSGYRQWDSFLYSTLMSTFFWEYGIEAFAETPSMQDLVVTPVLGWVYGEWAFNTERAIWMNGGTVLGSENLGNLSLFLLDPVDSVGRNINRLFGADIIKAGTSYIKLSESKNSGKKIMFELNYTFGEEHQAAQQGISGKRKTVEYYTFTPSKDPVNSSIIGLSLGVGNLHFDSKRGHRSEQYLQTSLGLYFTPTFSSRLNYTSTNMLKGMGKPTVNFESFSVDGQYYFNTNNHLRPYLTGGVGEEIWEENNDSYRFQINAGLGLHYKLNANWALQAEAINYYTDSTSTNDQQVTTKLVYRFAQGEHH